MFAQFFPPTVFFFSVWLSALENGKCEEASQHQHQPQLKKNIFIENSFPGDLTRKRPEIRLSREYQNRKKLGLKFSWSSETLPNSTSCELKKNCLKIQIWFHFFNRLCSSFSQGPLSSLKLVSLHFLFVMLL